MLNNLENTSELSWYTYLVQSIDPNLVQGGDQVYIIKNEMYMHMTD